ncbi:helix-turn-helix domain-containing protein [Sulfobacillus harzensis]|uniref:Helix-turn-helix domain-containing protein n=1 Tax=Sulfobacillus harzensis TaxID=2729629 RepID=A0A7Y0L4N8_9FIRM|nr:helix-turn-helix domain-containing protein [Sulfobacillus harzensis]NMP22897.1 helix-turn-helix domain-containing protein [Sulfobacillus harzensis]
MIGESALNPDIAPSFGAWLQITREGRGWTISELADRAQLPRSTLATLESRARRSSRPRPEVIHSVAAATGLPVLGIAVIAGYFERDMIDVGTDALFDRIQLAAFQGLWWQRQGGAYLRVVRESQGVSIDAAAKRWSDLWGALSVTGEEWNVLESQGYVPDMWESIVRMRNLNRLPGAWLWALTHAIGGDLADLLGFAFIMARVSAVRCERPWHAKDDYDQLSRAVKTHRQAFEELVLGPYRSDVRRVKWTIPDVRELARRSTKEARREAPVNDAEGIARVVWGYLEDQHPGITKVRQDTFLAHLVSKWDNLSGDAKSQIARILEESEK